MNYLEISVADDAAIRTVTLDRPERLNALSARMLDELRDAVERAPAAGARAIVVTGAGRGFSSGADLAGGDGAGMPDDLGAALEAHFNPLLLAMAAAPVPIIAAVNGPAAGAGASIALAADIVVAARSAYFLQAFVNIGLVPDAGATWVLPRLAGRARAMEMMLLGERVSAAQAQDWGMIARVVDDEALADEAGAIARRLADGPTLALGLTRALIHGSAARDLAAALDAERHAQRDAGRSADFRAGVTAFLTRTTPRFEGR